MASDQTHPKKIPRRQFLRRAAWVGAVLGFSACQIKNPNLSPIPASAVIKASLRQPTPTPTPYQLPTPPVPPQPSPSLPPSPAPTRTVEPDLWVAAARVPAGEGASIYDQALIRQALEGMLDGLGGLAGIIRPGARVGIKVNLTGGPWSDGLGKPKAVETYVTHPAVAGALGELLRDAGAGQLTIMDGLGDDTAFEKWGYTDVAKSLGASLVNLCKPAPYQDYQRFSVGDGRLVYDYFWMNPLLAELDVFISVAKLKVHSTAGVTLSMKNLIGLTPIERYKSRPADTNRSALHAAALYVFDERLPRVIVDLNRARPIHFALIDGISTCEGGAGPWEKTLNQVRPGLLVAGRNPVATDSVATHLMGFDPQAAAKTVPFLHGENHLALAAQAGLGTHSLSEITVFGPSLQELAFPFKPAE
jgi:uncharacterized protein (DUF362 family)